MLIRCWGARGSTPVSGREYLKYGGDTTCIELRTGDGEVLIVDAGSGIRSLGNLLLDEGRKEISLLLTHAHWDHLLGFPFFAPVYADGCAVRILGCPCAQTSVRDMIAHAMEPPNFPVPLNEARAELTFRQECDEPFAVAGIRVTPIPLSHPNGGLGYRFSAGGREFVFLTDNELGYRHPDGMAFDGYVDACADADLLIHDAQFTPAEYERRRRWGHSTFADALALARRAGVARLGLFHHDPDRTDDAVDAIERDCRQAAEREGADLSCFAVRQGMQIDL